MKKFLLLLTLEILLATSLFLPGFMIGWGLYPPIVYSIVFVFTVAIYLLVIKSIPASMAVLVTVPIIVLQLANVVTYYQFGFPFEYGVFQILINADWDEATEFIPVVKLSVLIKVLVLSGFYLICTWWLVQSPFKFKGRRNRLFGLVLIAIAVPSLNHFHRTRYDVYSYYYIYRLAFEYSTWQRDIEQASKTRAARFLTAKSPLSLKEQKTTLDDIVIVVIGESLRRRNMSLYGYKRQTTPLLDKRKNELIIFDHVISPSNSTIMSLMHMLTPLTVTRKKNILNVPSLVGEVRVAGFDTSWISNTNLLGRYASNTTIMARDANRVLVTRPEGHNEKFYLSDLTILPLFDKLLKNNNARKKFFFLATRGSHALYRRRVPDSFRKFLPMPSDGSRYSPRLREKIVNAYDNTVLVTDWFLDQLIQRLEKTGVPATLIYFSDHGERLYDDGKTMFHGSSRSPRKTEYQVPFIIWQSKVRNCKIEKLHAIKHQSINMQYFFKIAKYATCINKRLPKNLYDPHVIARNKLVNYEELKEH